VEKEGLSGGMTFLGQSKSSTITHRMIKKGEPVKRMFAILMVCVLAVAVSGCAKKSASEQLEADMNKAAKQMKKDMNNV